MAASGPVPTRSVRSPRWTGGPPLAFLAGVSAALFLLGVIVSLALAGALPSPFASADTIMDFYRDPDGDDSVRVTGFLQVGSATPTC